MLPLKRPSLRHLSLPDADDAMESVWRAAEAVVLRTGRRWGRPEVGRTRAGSAGVFDTEGGRFCRSRVRRDDDGCSPVRGARAWCRGAVQTN